MQRVCQNCKRCYGEKCAKCGSFNVCKMTEGMDESVPTLFACLDCLRVWKQGEDPETTGICPTCFQRIYNYPLPS